ncbi:NAD(P)-dependent alcohol dehydrogenase [Allocatelliglobosispora scoriae]|nr:NAD(P)-dependent alcohol dehydrogenase [Allocatelliglobosispora scoriae]
MRAVAHEAYGPPAVLDLVELPRPVPGDDEVLLRVRAAAANFADLCFLRGEPRILRLAGAGLGKPKNQILGTDVAGLVEAVGRNVTALRVGDEVFGRCDGSFAEYVIAAPADLVVKPADLGFPQAAGVAMAGLTALQALRDQAGVMAGQRVLINGAAGGIGTFAVQIAKAFGAEVTGVCSTPNVELVRSLGADHVIDYTQADFTAGGRVYDVILDNVENHPLAACRRVLAPTGTFIPNSGHGGRWIGSVGRLLKAVVLARFTRQRIRVFMSSCRQADLVVLRELISSGQVVPVVDRVYPLAETAAALAYLGEGHARGKVVITV